VNHDLPDLPSGVWRHYKGPLYLVLGYGHDANALGDATTYDDTVIGTHSTEASEWLPLEERIVVVYLGLELTDAHTGPRLAVRTAEDFLAWLHPDDWSVCPEQVTISSGDGMACDCPHYATFESLVRRFTYVGPSWDGQRA
jgi:hypothetical protein